MFTKQEKNLLCDADQTQYNPIVKKGREWITIEKMNDCQHNNIYQGVCEDCGQDFS